MTGPEPAAALTDAQMLRDLLDAIPARVVAVSRDHRFLYLNQEALDFLQTRSERLVGRRLADVLGPAYESEYLPLHERIFEGRETVRKEGWVTYPNFGLRYVQEHFFPHAPAGGPVQAAFVFVRDLTDLKHHEAELSAKIAQLEVTETLKAAIVDNALAAFISADEQGRIVEFNRAAEIIFGHRRAEVLGRDVGEVVVPPQHRSAHLAGMQRLRQGGAPRMLGRRVEMQALRADGSEFPVEMVLFRTEVGGRSYYTSSMVDLSERVLATREIERQREALRHSEKLSAMGSLLAGVAHELNNPLAIVMGRASLLEEKCAEVPALQALHADTTRIREAAERCGRIVRTFLNMARNRPAQRGDVALNDLVRAAIEMMAYSLRTHGIEVSQELAAGLPEVSADPDQLGQIVLNLLVNAQQALAAHEGPRRLHISTGLEAPRDQRTSGTPRELRVWLRVADSGRGVPPELRERVFEPFFTTKAEGLGTGLGLAVSRTLAREHGGELLLEAAAPGQGARFRLSLPISGQPLDGSLPLPLDEVEPSRQARLLVVDDENEIADLMRAMLESAGYEVATAESGAVALELLAEARFDALVSDLRMPDMDGAALWRHVRQRHPALARRMLFVTGDTLSADARSFLAEARCTSLDKPFSKADLLECVRALLQE